MRTVSHREMRNNSGEILRTRRLAARGQARSARSPLSTLATIQRRQSDLRSGAIVADVRGRW
jgi:hypothetical protein